MLSVQQIRAAFPILQRRIADCPLVYLDNAATSLTPDAVLEAEQHFYRHIGGNVHRGTHALSEEASQAFEAARAQIARFIGASSAEVVFTSNATAALNLVADGLSLPEGAEVLTLPGDHHSTLLPWRKRWQTRPLDASPLRPLDPEVLRRAIGSRTKAVVLSHASNVTGLVQPVAALCRVAREHGLISVIDAAQSAPHLALDVRAIGCDFLAFSGHKMLGPTGVGVLYARESALERLTSTVLGGGVVERVTVSNHELRSGPARFEAGTPNIAGVLGLAAATQFLERIGWQQIREHGQLLARALAEGLAAQRSLRALVVEGEALPIVSLVAPDAAVRLDDIAMALSDRYGIMTRAGLQCAHPLFQSLAMPSGALRVSAYLYNTVEEVNVLCDSLVELMSAFG